MRIIGVLNAKGGTGKTTITTNLAARAAQKYRRVGVLDIDPQQGAHRWFDNRGENNNPQLLVGENDPADAYLKLQNTGWDIIVIDGGASILERTVAAIDICDFVLIPMRSGDQDANSTRYVAAACIEASKPYMIVINDAISKNDKRAHAMRTALKDTAGQPVAETIIVRRALLEDCMAVGKAVCEFEQKSHEAARKDIEGLYQEIMKALKAHKSSKASGGRRER